MTSAQLINQDSGDVEYYTPAFIIEAARATMGGIELDPFSSLEANKRVKAERIYTEADDGFAQEWKCNSLWMNHPFSRHNNKRMGKKIVEAHASGRVRQACCITFAATSEAWFQPLMGYPQCYLAPRTNYYLPDGTFKKGVSKGSVVTYFGPDLHRFALFFGEHGAIKVHMNQ